MGGGVQQNQVRIEGRENEDMGAVAPYSGFPFNLQMNETRILIRLLRMYIPRNWEFGSTLAKFRGEGGFDPPTTTPPFGTPLYCEDLHVECYCAVITITTLFSSTCLPCCRVNWEKMLCLVDLASRVMLYSKTCRSFRYFFQFSQVSVLRRVVF
jgi:hypothetical protein